MKMQPSSPTEVTPLPYEATTNNWPIILPHATDAGNMGIASLTFILFASLRHPWWNSSNQKDNGRSTEKERRWMNGRIFHERCKSVHNVHTHETPIIQSLLGRYNNPWSVALLFFISKPWDLLTRLQQTPGYISDQWGQITGWGEWAIQALSAFWPHEWRISFPKGNNCNLDTLFFKERSLKAAYKVSMLCHVSVLCITAAESFVNFVLIGSWIWKGWSLYKTEYVINKTIRF